jgi:hypothetical protein
MSEFDRRMNQGGLLFWSVTAAAALAAYLVLY